MLFVSFLFDVPFEVQKTKGEKSIDQENMLRNYKTPKVPPFTSIILTPTVRTTESK